MHPFIPTCMSTYTHTFIHTEIMHTHIYSKSKTHRTYIHAFIHTYIHAYICIMQAYIHTHIMQSYIYTYTKRHIVFTYINTSFRSLPLVQKGNFVVKDNTKMQSEFRQRTAPDDVTADNKMH